MQSILRILGTFLTGRGAQQDRSEEISEAGGSFNQAGHG